MAIAELASVNLLITTPLLFALLTIGHGIFNAYFHPLSSFPGPKLWSTTYLFRHVANIRGQMDWKIKAFHEQYGPVVRFSPDELSFISEQAWKDIYGFKAEPLVKDPASYNVVKLGNNKAKSIFNAEPADHPRIRKSLSHAFSEKALREQEPLMKEYVDLLVGKLKGIADSGNRADMVSWFNFTTFDMIGFMALGKSFGCLRDSTYHSWVESLWKSIKIGPYMRLVATYLNVEKLLRILAPPSIRKARERHERYTWDTTRERMAKGIMKDSKDFLSYILAHREDQEKLSDDEVAANCGFILMAGSETTATALSGTTYYLLKNPRVMNKLKKEILGAFAKEDEINFANAAARLPYTQACLNEAFRVYPPGPTMAPRRTPNSNEMTMIDGHMVPPWTVVGVHALSAISSISNFHKPSEFIPERWLPENVNDPASPFHNDQRGSSQPFSFGPRNCLGKGLAWNELRVILARIIWNFDMELCSESWTWEKQVSYTLWEKPALWVTLKIRDNMEN